MSRFRRYKLRPKPLGRRVDPTCPTCGGTRRWGGAIFHLSPRECRRLERRGLAVRVNHGHASGTMLLDRDGEIQMRRSLRGSHRHVRSYTRCLDPFHESPMPVCRESICSAHGQLSHWHEDGPGRFQCPGICMEIEPAVAYQRSWERERCDNPNPHPEHQACPGVKLTVSADDPHWHRRSDLPAKLPGPERATVRAKNHRTRQNRERR